MQQLVCFLQECSACDHFYEVSRLKKNKGHGDQSSQSVCLSVYVLHLAVCLGYMIQPNGMAVPLPNFDQTDAGVTAFTD